MERALIRGPDAFRPGNRLRPGAIEFLVKIADAIGQVRDRFAILPALKKRPLELIQRRGVDFVGKIDGIRLQPSLDVLIENVPARR